MNIDIDEYYRDQAIYLKLMDDELAERDARLTSARLQPAINPTSLVQSLAPAQIRSEQL